MTQKEKAKELVDKYYQDLPQWVNISDAKQCAIIAVNEIIKTSEDTSIYGNQFLKYWKKVLQEIELI
jgi:hypothetical protein